MARAKKTARPSQVDKLLEALERAEAEKRALTDLLSRQNPGIAMGTSGMVVGIRNVSSYTLGLVGSPIATEAEVQLYPEFDGPNPNSVAVISYAWWQQLRRGKWFDRGMIIRDDSVLGDAHQKAPADRPSDLAANHSKNVVLDPHKFISAKSEDELRDAINNMTSEESLRRLWAAVDEQIGRERVKFAHLESKVREEKAVRALPAMYKLAEDLVIARLDEIGPRRDI